MQWSYILFLFSFIVLYKDGEAIMCHRCYSAMGGCGKSLEWWMFPWKDCGDSKFCVKITEKKGSEQTIIRECENNLMRTTKHRLQMPNLRRSGYCLYARINDAKNPLKYENKKIEYCFCNDWNGCNTASGVSARFLPIFIVSSVVTFLIGRLYRL